MLWPRQRKISARTAALVYFVRKIDVPDQWRLDPDVYGDPPGIPSACLTDLADPDSAPSIWEIQSDDDIVNLAAALTLQRGRFQDFFAIVFSAEALEDAGRPPVYDGQGVTPVSDLASLHWTMGATTAPQLLAVLNSVRSEIAAGDAGGVGRPGIRQITTITLAARLVRFVEADRIGQLTESQKGVLKKARALASGPA